MARNCEKNLTRLNRWWLQQQEEKTKKKELLAVSEIKTANEGREALKQINAELEHLLAQLGSTRNYPAQKLREFEERVDYLKRERKRYIERIFELDPAARLAGTPGDPHAYISKRQAVQEKAREAAQKRPRTDLVSNNPASQNKGPVALHISIAIEDEPPPPSPPRPLPTQTQSLDFDTSKMPVVGYEVLGELRRLQQEGEVRGLGLDYSSEDETD